MLDVRIVIDIIPILWDRVFILIFFPHYTQKEKKALTAYFIQTASIINASLTPIGDKTALQHL